MYWRKMRKRSTEIGGRGTDAEEGGSIWFTFIRLIASRCPYLESAMSLLRRICPIHSQTGRDN